MITVIKHGNSSKHAVCNHCGAEMIYSEADVIETRKNQYFESESHHWRSTVTRSITCPDCGEDIILKVCYEDTFLPNLVG